MPASRLEARVQRLPDRAEIDLTGQIDAGAEEPLGAAYESAADGAETLRLRFAGVDYINSTGIALIVDLLARARVDGGRIEAHGLSDHYREIFEITRLDEAISIYDSEVEAVTAAAA